ncbi:hypothetical protein BZL30_6830 [Mycobacterium kansasii]|uniref:CoA-transferase III family protein n=1 Tax=Mycobacterium kansasii TaxID=1768 RepID=A0A1V3WRD2_MYCKA|nr:hypothetical protein BZL30_6830 [Mycobacterium kansasii]
MSAGGATRLLAAADGWLAITVSRPDDAAAVPALLQVDRLPEDPWPAIQRWAATSCVSTILERTQLLDIPAAALGEVAPAPPRIRRIGPRAAVREPAGLLVVDLSSMWAGPLCGHLLARAGATVVKIESPAAPTAPAPATAPSSTGSTVKSFRIASISTNRPTSCGSC